MFDLQIPPVSNEILENYSFLIDIFCLECQSVLYLKVLSRHKLRIPMYMYMKPQYTYDRKEKIS